MPFTLPGARRSFTPHPPPKNPLLSPPLSPSPNTRAFSATPLLDPETFDTAPFSESFSAILDLAPLRDESFLASPPDTVCSSPDVMKGARRLSSMKADASYYVEQLTNIRDVDSEWEDDEVEEVMIISPKTRYSSLPRISSILSTAMSATACSPTVVSQIPLPSSPPPQDAYTVLRAVHRTPTSTLALAVLPQASPSHTLFAIRICRRPLSRADRTERACLELIASALVESPYIQRMYRTWEDGPMLYIICEYYEGGNILGYVQREGRVGDTVSKRWSSEIASGLSFIHDLGIIHGALKPSSILLRASGHAVIGGFKHATIPQSDRDETDLDLTLTNGGRTGQPTMKEWHEAPEILLSWEVGFEVDVWAYGIVLGWMICGKHPFVTDPSEMTPGVMRSRILQGPVPSGTLGAIDFEMQDVIKKCLERNPAKRPGIARVMASDIFADVDWNRLSQSLGPNIPISVPLPTTVAPNALSPELPKVIIPPPVFFPQTPEALSSPWCPDFSSPTRPEHGHADLESVSSANDTSITSDHSNHSGAVLAQAQRVQLADARPVSLALSTQSGAASPVARPRNPSPPSLGSTQALGSGSTDARASFLPCLSEEEGAVPVAPGVSVTEFGRWVCDEELPDAAIPGNVAGIGAAMSKAERAMCRRALNDEISGADELSILTALALPIPVLVTPRPARTESSFEGSRKEARTGRRKLRKLSRRRKEGGVMPMADPDPRVFSEAERRHTTTDVGLGIHVPEICWHGFDDADPFRRESVVSVLPPGVGKWDDGLQANLADRDKTFRWSAISLDAPPVAPAHHSTLSQKLRTRSRLLLKKSRSSFFASEESVRVDGGDCVELGVGVRKMGRGIGYTRGSAPPVPPMPAPMHIEGIEAMASGLVQDMAGAHAGACYPGLGLMRKGAIGHGARCVSEVGGAGPGAPESASESSRPVMEIGPALAATGSL